MPDVRLRTMEDADRDAVAALVHDSTNTWYEAHGRGASFAAGPRSTRVFCDVYESLDPGCCLLAVDAATDELLGSCFYRRRPTHVSLGIMNVHPDHFGRSVASTLLRRVCEIADDAGLPLRLVSSAMNLDSFSLYTRAGFVPRAVYQDMVLSLPEGEHGPRAPGIERVRAATLEDVGAIAALGEDLEGLWRERDFRYFLETPDLWHVSVIEDDAGALTGCLASIAHPGTTMLGPGFSRLEPDAAALILTELEHRRGHTPLFVVPAACPELVETLYRWGARNRELHVHQCRGPWRAPRGVSIPTFLPETA